MIQLDPAMRHGPQIEKHPERHFELEVISHLVAVMPPAPIIHGVAVVAMAAERAVHKNPDHVARLTHIQLHVAPSRLSALRRFRVQRSCRFHLQLAAAIPIGFNRADHIIEDQLLRACKCAVLGAFLLYIAVRRKSRQYQKHRHARSHWSFSSAHWTRCLTSGLIPDFCAIACSTGTDCESRRSTLRSMSAICTSGSVCFGIACSKPFRATGLSAK